MEIPPSAPSPAQTALRPGPGALIRGWAVGQVLEATVLAVTAPDRVVLTVAGRRFEAQTEATPRGPTLRPGAPLTLRVEANGPPTVLRVLPPDAPASPAVEVQRAALREALPRAEPLAPALTAAASLAAEAADNPAGLPPRTLAPETVHALRNLLRSVPEVTRLTTAEGLRGAIENSGVFLESRLAALPAAAPAPASDLKAALLVLGELLSRAAAAPEALAEGPPAASGNAPRPAADPPVGQRQAAPAATAAGPPTAAAPEPAAALARVEGALARIELNQLRSVPLADGPHPGWLVEIPVRTSGGFDLLTLHIEREGRERRGRPPEAWQVSVRLELEPLGPLQATVRWQAGALSATLRADREATAVLLERNAPGLVQALQEAGLPNAAVRCLRAPLADTAAHGLPERLLDLTV